jgi:uncharacterized protein (TIGR00251 family)
MTFYRWEGKNLILSVHVQPRASKTGIVGIHGNQLKIKITKPPIDGQANTELCKLLSKLFGVAKSQIILQTGHTSREKSFLIQSPKKLPEMINPPK